MDPEGYALAVERALEGLNDIDIASQLERCGGAYNEASCTGRLDLFCQSYTMEFPSGEIAEGDPALVRRLILLHYLGRSDGIGPSGKMVTFREVPDGNFYYHSFHDRVIMPFLVKYGSDPNSLRERCEELGWTVREEGDVSYGTNALPLIPVRMVLWLGDEEFTPEATMLFDSHISHHLPTEDIALLGEVAVNVLTG